MKRKLIFQACIYLLSVGFLSCSNHGGNHPHNSSNSETMIQKPKRASHTFEQTINGSIKDVMPLYCPIREMDWVDGWKPDRVISNSGVVEKDCYFITSHGDDQVTWIVSDYNIETGSVEMYRLESKYVITKLEILATAISDTTTKAVITYSKTALNEEGEKMVVSFTEKEYHKMMNWWEKSMNHYLATGQKLKSEHH